MQTNHTVENCHCSVLVVHAGGGRIYVGVKLWDEAATINVDAVDGKLNLSHLPGIERSHVQSGINKS